MKVEPVNDIPTVSITTHQTGQTVMGVVIMQGKAGDVEKDVKSVEILLTRAGAEPGDVKWVTAEGTDPWLFTWDTTAKGVRNGDYDITFRSKLFSVTVYVAFCSLFLPFS